MFPATHFAPVPRRLSANTALGSTTLITITALAGVSGFVRNAFSERLLNSANRAAMLDIEAIEDQNCFIPHLTVTTFADAVAKLSGEPYFTLALAPHLTMASKGCWADYMLAAPTLGRAIERAIGTIGFHSKGDTMSLAVSAGEARLSYASAARVFDGYLHVAIGTVGILLSLCRHFLSAAWRPLRIEFDLARPKHRTAFEDSFDCPVIFDAPSLSLCFEASELARSRAAGHQGWPITVADIARARVECRTLNSVRDVILQQIWTQVQSGEVSVESAACSLDTSVRTLQRELNREGTNFRELANAMRTRRAAELLRDTTSSVTEISAVLGYSAPAHFARAFRKGTGRSPHEFRRHLPSQIAV
ncbi:AraC family transcriptional regulator [Ancylobacter pratisalsi]|uniref:AraC family transcriptional regulator n=1 Tax=Ancylobacter pratisalsi TaxID=1745854 RepID=A0A6P1YP65_9HYPH|nr:AraC family transcriptional regulator [Ancylobacter pratisalsi]QIB34521.1 AraC family transcriptional regulator [Ancylobacter pratisalsi]